MSSGLVHPSASGSTTNISAGPAATPEHGPNAAVAANSESAAIALVGNPNVGKTALFNALTGYRRHVANYPGVSVDVARGPVRGASRALEVLDLPGTYSLTPASPDETIVCDVLCGHAPPRPAAILAIVDATNLPRNLYLLSQVLEVGLPAVIALNMIDAARARGIEVDARLLAERLGLPVVPVIATQPETVAPLVPVLESALRAAPPATRVPLPDALARATGALVASAPAPLQPAKALRVLADQDGYSEKQFLKLGGDRCVLAEAREALRAAGIDPGPAEVRARYAWIDRILDGVVIRNLPPGDTWSDRIDRLLTHRVAGVAALAALLYAAFYTIYAGAQPLMDAIDGGVGWLGLHVGELLPDGALRSLVTEGVLGGVGGVLAFLPQILTLFALIAILEDCGYMARAAFMVDRLMRPLGLSGRAFIPLLSSFACAVPAIMGARAIGDRRERFITILIAPFMSCSARLPVYTLLIGALVPAHAWLGGWVRLDALVMLGMYLVGVVFAIPIALLLRKTAFAGPSTGFVLELPGYKWPRLRTVLQRMYLAGWSFVVRAGTVILAVNIVVWALGYFPRSADTRAALEQQQQAAGWDDATFESQLAGAYLRESYLGRLGRVIEPAIEPLGWDWRIGIGVLSSFPAREVVIATLGTISNLGEESDARSPSLRSAIQAMTWEDTGKPLFTLPVALSLMVFFALCAQCVSTLVVIGRETHSWMWPCASFVGMTTLAFLVAWGTSAAGRALGL